MAAREELGPDSDGDDHFLQEAIVGDAVEHAPLSEGSKDALNKHLTLFLVQEGTAPALELLRNVHPELAHAAVEGAMARKLKNETGSESIETGGITEG
jgi:hypothetical protein